MHVNETLSDQEASHEDHDESKESVLEYPVEEANESADIQPTVEIGPNVVGKKKNRLSSSSVVFEANAVSSFAQ